MNTIPEIKLYGIEHCHKTQYYIARLKEMDLPFEFLDVEKDKDHAEALRGLYENRKLNFPTITIGTKKLRNPSDDELRKWIHKLIPQMLQIEHDKENSRYKLNINGAYAKVDYVLKNDIMYLVHSEVPYELRGQGIGKVLVEKTFEKLTEEGYRAKAVCSYVKAVARRSDTWKEIIL